MKLDDVDIKLISILRRDARATNIALARQVGLTEGAVRHRIGNLIASGAIRKFTIETSSEGGFYAVVMLKATGNVKKMMHDVSAMDIALHSYEISGEFDGCVILEGMGMEEVDAQIDKIRKIRTVRDTKTYVVLKRWR